MQFQTIEPNVDLVRWEDREVYLVGTAHVSRSSAELVERVIRELRPDTICIELCASRHDSLRNPDRWKNTDLFSVVRSGKSYLLMVQLALASFQKQVAKQFGIQPGEEMRVALRLSDELAIPISVVDRDIRTTLKRAWAQASLWSLIKLFFGLCFSMGSKEELEESTIEELKKGDSLSSLLAEFSEYLPGVKGALIDERDRYMAQKIFEAPGKRIVAVLGAGHIPGIKKLFGQPISLDELETVPPPRKSLQYIGWSVPALFCLFLFYGFFHLGQDVGVEMLSAWILSTGSAAAIGAILTLAHPLTIVSGFLAAPITTLHPLLAAGWVCGLVEAFVRKPRVSDLQTLTDDVSSIKGLFHNRASRVLLIIAIVNLTATIGAISGFGYLASILG